MPRRSMPLLLILAALASLSACGQKGPLILPQTVEPIAAPAEIEEKVEESDMAE